MDVDQGSAIVWSVVEFPAFACSQLERESSGVGARPARCGRVRFCLLPCFFLSGWRGQGSSCLAVQTPQASWGLLDFNPVGPFRFRFSSHAAFLSLSSL